MKVDYKDTSMLTEQEKTILQNIIEEYSQKINVEELIIDLKVVNKGGKRKRYTIIVNAKDYHAKVEDWDLSKTVHKALKKIINEINHKDRKNIFGKLFKI